MPLSPKQGFAALFSVAIGTTLSFASLPGMAQMSAPDLDPIGGSASPDIPSTSNPGQANPLQIQSTPNNSQTNNSPGLSIRPIGPYVTPIDYK